MTKFNCPSCGGTGIGKLHVWYDDKGKKHFDATPCKPCGGTGQVEGPPA